MIGIYYFTFPDYPEFIFLLSYLNKKDVFIDIGSNQGLYTLFVSGIIGSKTISIEPVQNTYKRLLLNLKLNNLKNVEPLNIGLSNQIGIINMSNNKGELNKILINDDDNSEMVTVSTLDQITQNKKNISLLKIDVEGYEKFILEGGINTLKNINLKVILIELNGSNEYYNYSTVYYIHSAP